MEKSIIAPSQAARLPVPVRFREVNGRGLLVNLWVNGAGPYTFAIDTGAGATILSRRLAEEARVSLGGRRPLAIGGISGRGTVSGQEVAVRSLAIGYENNLLPSSGLVIVTETLAPGVDGVLDPTEAYWPLG
ncbi:MAG: aspartyl protease family protein, partial [Acidobacteriota bacterium]|nr:aspartyl protease family protein [Acidobacteriota bacterium]